VNGAAAAVSVGVCAAAVHHAKKTLAERQVPLLGMTAAFVFAAQMLNFPIGFGTSGHFLGTLLAAVLVGPLNAVLVIALVLVIQALGFADGGISSLGTNILNMGIVPILAYYLVFVGLRALARHSRRMLLVAAAVASWVAIVGAAACCAAELAISGTYPLYAAMTAMLSYHVIIGVGEAFITAAVLGAVLAVRPDLVAAWQVQKHALAPEATKA
jgi:cobalt/nickel transport system permease protein